MAGEIYFNNLTGQFDWGSLVDKILQLKSLPLQRLKEEAATLKVKQDAYSSVLGKVNDLKSLVETTNVENLFNQKRATSSNTDVVTATASSNTPNVSFNVEVQSLAQREMLLSTGSVSSLDQTISWNAFTLKLNTGSAIETYGTVQGGSGTIQDLVNAINSLPNSKIEASVFFDGSGYRLLLAEKDEGASTFETSPGNTAILIDYQDPNNGFGAPLRFLDSANPLQLARNAQIKIGGSTTLTSSTNTFNDVVTGLSITAKSIGSSTVKVEEDYSPVSNFLQDLINKYNETIKQVNNLTGLDKPMQGNQVLININRTLSKALEPLMREGFLNVSDGALSLDKTALEKAISSNKSRVQSLIQNVVNNVKSFVSGVSTDLNNITKDYEQRIENLNTRAANLYESLKKEESRLKLEFSKVEAFINQSRGIMEKLQSFIVTLSEMQGGRGR